MIRLKNNLKKFVKVPELPKIIDAEKEFLDHANGYHIYNTGCPHVWILSGLSGYLAMCQDCQDILSKKLKKVLKLGYYDILIFCVRMMSGFLTNFRNRNFYFLFLKKTFDSNSIAIAFLHID